MSLTLKELELLNTASAYNGEQHRAICGKAALELIEYKKIEEDFGIGLITLFKALRDGIYEKSKNGKVFFTDYDELSLGYQWYSNEYEAIQNDTTIYEGYEFGLLSSGELLRLEDYGITWALTKEELL